jgi:hypothetical protein
MGKQRASGLTPRQRAWLGQRLTLCRVQLESRTGRPPPSASRPPLPAQRAADLAHLLTQLAGQPVAPRLPRLSGLTRGELGPGGAMPRLVPGPGAIPRTIRRSLPPGLGAGVRAADDGDVRYSAPHESILRPSRSRLRRIKAGAQSWMK